MVTPLFLPGLVKVDHHMTYAGRDWHVIRWHKFPDEIVSLSASEVTHVAQTHQDAFSPLHAFTSQHNQFIGTTATDFSDDTGLTGNVSAGGFGTETSADLPIQVAVEIGWKIGRHYRGGHPKTYLSGMTEGQLDGIDQWASSFLTGLEAAANAYLAALQLITIVRGSTSFVGGPVNLSRFAHHAERAVALVDSLISGTPNNTTASQRRRRGRI
jgi:hypothetical protein